MVGPRRNLSLPFVVLTGLGLHYVAASAPMRDLCPETCKASGINPSNWTVLADLVQLEACNRPVVLDFSVITPVTSTQYIRACNVWADDFFNPAGPANLTSSSNTETAFVSPELAWTGATDEHEIGGRLAAQSVEHLQSFLENSPEAQARTTLFGTSAGTTVGVYVGAGLVNPSVAGSLFAPFVGALYQAGLANSKSTLIQVCDGRSSDQTFGLIAAASADFTTVHHAVGQWANGTCVDTSSYGGTLELKGLNITVVKPLLPTPPTPTPTPTPPSESDVASNSTSTGKRLQARADCRTVSVIQGDGCGSLVTRCGGGLTAANFYKYNPASNLCSTLKVGQKVCCTTGTLPAAPVVKDPPSNADGTCKTVKVARGDLCSTTILTKCGGGVTAAQIEKFNSAPLFCYKLQEGQRVCCTPGALPDIRPKKNADGTCFAYKIVKDDNCSKVGMAHGELTKEDLEKFNKKTWRWNGCGSGFWPDNWICLSEGTPPFPLPIANAVCGPQKPGSIKPAGSSSDDWAAMNPCPLNACCNTWGQCGTTADFCVDTNTGAPGTAKVDTYGCISNCGMGMVIGSAPKQFIKLGYFEGFNLGRECLNMDATQIDPSYTHIHFAFGMIDKDFNIYQDGKYAEYQFQQFKKLRGPKRIISFGGWVFSAEAPNYPIFRNGVKNANRVKLADNLVKYVVDNGLDGLDIDWEYPSAPDLPDLGNPGDPSEAADYLKLLSVIRQKLPQDKSLSIAVPASFWYLKQFPIQKMSTLLDYIVYMTYDLHGQWDAGNKWATPGCPTGNCLRSHVNITETLDALAMITRAGVPSSKVLVGVSSYGRSFQMADPSCTGPDCFFTGDRVTSYARKGRCTQTGGYLANAEIAEIKGRTWRDSRSNSDIMVDGDLWVSYMSDELKASRTALYKRYNMGGTIDWAVDLVKFQDPPNVTVGDKTWGVTWQVMKENINSGQPAACSLDTHSGKWFSNTCTHTLSQFPLQFPTRQRWEGLDCASAWDDVIRYWETCFQGRSRRLLTDAIAEYFGLSSDMDCGNTAHETQCSNQVTCNSMPNTGACASEVWNSIVKVHIMIKNYYYSLGVSGNNLRARKEEFISTFAPRGEDGTKIIDLLMGLLPIPMTVAGSRFFGSTIMSQSFFANDISGNKKQIWETATMGLVDMGMGIAADALKDMSGKREEIAFNDIYDQTIAAWQGQTDKLMAKVFSGNEESINALTALIRSGAMVHGGEPIKQDTDVNVSENTVTWQREKAIEKAFYAVSIPSVWAANRMFPVVAVWPEDKKCEIDARGYFAEGPDKYNVGWRCVNGRSYILAGVYEKAGSPCGAATPMGGCNPVKTWTLNILDGIEEIQGGNTKWGGVSVGDLIEGALNTFGKDNKNVMDPSLLEKELKLEGQNLQDAVGSETVDVRRRGFIRIPVCSPEEVKTNLAKGYHKDWYNFPCNPPP